ncbi:hypothetical protein LOCC1_G008191 [Lachnellula occidentalis]|uniref:DUF7907 domain-containing protein n=1 Tax=Lachnellula occidentalis TaxID=215460 RepID=A0A8H8RVV6_9HELO|nr:hypothetical protein LOCC1_G008191 [Lachnellula occidentalis]
MHISTTTGFLALAVAQFITLALAQNISSAPFYLVLKSKKLTLDGAYLLPCHEGAALSALCPTTKPLTNLLHSQFSFNTTHIAAQSPLNDGVLAWNQPASTGLNDTPINIPQAMSFQYDDSSNVAVALFFFHYPTLVEFASDDQLKIFSYRDDTKPLALGTGPSDHTQHLSRWYVCDTIVTSYLYQTLAWVLGKGKPQNPSCQKVEVFRKWV